jgi:hypothetical protein
VGASAEGLDTTTTGSSALRVVGAVGVFVTLELFDFFEPAFGTAALDLPFAADRIASMAGGGASMLTTSMIGSVAPSSFTSTSVSTGDGRTAKRTVWFGTPIGARRVGGVARGADELAVAILAAEGAR